MPNINSLRILKELRENNFFSICKVYIHLFLFEGIGKILIIYVFINMIIKSFYGSLKKLSNFHVKQNFVLNLANVFQVFQIFAFLQSNLDSNPKLSWVKLKSRNPNREHF
jgi:hypothetical protein